MEKVNRQDLVDAVCEEAHLSKKDARTAIDIVFAKIEEAVLNGQDVNIANFGVFVPKTRQSRDGTHPKSHDKIVIKETRTISFRVSKALKEKMN